MILARFINVCFTFGFKDPQGGGTQHVKKNMGVERYPVATYTITPPQYKSIPNGNKNMSVPWPEREKMYQNIRKKSNQKLKKQKLISEYDFNNTLVFRYEHLDNKYENLQEKYDKLKKTIEKMSHEFLCPITGDFMKEPVITDAGHSYERIAIERWFTKNNTDPKTNQLLQSKKLIPNHNLRIAIDEFISHEKTNIDNNRSHS